MCQQKPLLDESEMYPEAELENIFGFGRVLFRNLCALR